MPKGVYLRRAGRIAGLAIAGALLASPAYAQKKPAPPSRPVPQQPAALTIPSNPDDAFVALREAARKNDVDRAAAISATLVDYPIPSYVEYFRIKPQMFDSSGLARIDAPDAEVAAFLQRYQGDAIADRMRNDWLLVLGKKRDWANFDIQYPQFVLKDDTQVECYALLSRALKGQNVAAEARAVLVDPRYYGEGCVDLIGYLAQSQQIQRSDVAFQARQALEQNYTTLAGKIAATVPDARVDSDALATVVKMARSDPAQAAAYLNTIVGTISRDEQGAAWGVIGQFAAKKLMPEAAGYYRRQLDMGGNQWLSDESRAAPGRLEAGAPVDRSDAPRTARQGSGMDVLVRARAQGRRPHRRRAGAIPVDRRPVQLLRPVGQRGTGQSHHAAATYHRERRRSDGDAHAARLRARAEVL
jgi:soluble lytic murein transglycosylase